MDPRSGYDINNLSLSKSVVRWLARDTPSWRKKMIYSLKSVPEEEKKKKKKFRTRLRYVISISLFIYNMNKTNK